MKVCSYIFFTVPNPSVQINQQDAQNLFPGNNLTLSCTIQPDPRLSLNAISVTSSWTMPDGQRLSVSDDDRIMIIEAIDSETFISRVVFKELYIADAGKYTCNGIIYGSSPFITNSSVGTNTTRVMITSKKHNVHNIIPKCYIISFLHCVIYLPDVLDSISMPI